MNSVKVQQMIETLHNAGWENQPLGYFKTKLKTNGILQNVVSGSSMKQNGVIIVTIEGDLP